MAIRGADVEQLTALANRLENQWANQIDQVINQVNTAVSGSGDIWMGPDADQFRNQIWPEHRQRLGQARDALVDAGQTAKRNAQRQEDTSSTIN